MERAETVRADIRQELATRERAGNAPRIAQARTALAAAEAELAGIVERRDGFRTQLDTALSRYGDMVVTLRA